MVRTFLLLGSNEGDRNKFLRLAQLAIADQIGSIERASAIYETEPWGNRDQPAFLNQVLIVSTRLSAKAVLEAIQAIESGAGRIRAAKWGPRKLDIDILFYGKEIVQTSSLILPHPAIASRRFTLVPLAEVDPEWEHPLLKLNMQTLLEKCEDQLKVKKVPSSEF